MCGKRIKSLLRLSATCVQRSMLAMYVGLLCYVDIGYIQFAVELKSCEELLGVIVANIDPAHVRWSTSTVLYVVRSCNHLFETHGRMHPN